MRLRQFLPGLAGFPQDRGVLAQEERLEDSRFVPNSQTKVKPMVTFGPARSSDECELLLRWPALTGVGPLDFDLARAHYFR